MELISFEDALKELLEDEEFAREYLGKHYRVDFAQFLYDFRILWGFTQKECAELLGMKKKQYRRIESGNKKLSMEEMSEIARKLGKKITLTFEDLQ